MALVAVAASLILTPVLVSSDTCAKKGVDPPSYNAGDQWEYRLESYGVEYLLTYICKGGDVVDGKNCWMLDISYNPPNYMGVFSNATIWYDKQKGPLAASPVRVQLWGAYQGLTCALSIENSSEFPRGQPFPLDKGKSFEAYTTAKTTQTRLGETSTAEQKTEFTYRVEGKDVIDAGRAGKFDCFRIVQYPKNSQRPVYVEWYSPEVKNIVQAQNVMTGEVQILRSYSLK
jgi:hypothetical protein